jgi:hypothetical protein
MNAPSESGPFTATPKFPPAETTLAASNILSGAPVANQLILFAAILTVQDEFENRPPSAGIGPIESKHSYAFGRSLGSSV